MGDGYSLLSSGNGPLPGQSTPSFLRKNNYNEDDYQQQFSTPSAAQHWPQDTNYNAVQTLLTNDWTSQRMQSQQQSQFLSAYNCNGVEFSRNYATTSQQRVFDGNESNTNSTLSPVRMRYDEEENKPELNASPSFKARPMPIGVDRKILALNQDLKNAVALNRVKKLNEQIEINAQKYSAGSIVSGLQEKNRQNENRSNITSTSFIAEKERQLSLFDFGNSQSHIDSKTCNYSSQYSTSNKENHYHWQKRISEEVVRQTSNISSELISDYNFSQISQSTDVFTYSKPQKLFSSQTTTQNVNSTITSSAKPSDINDKLPKKQHAIERRRRAKKHAEIAAALGNINSWPTVSVSSGLNMSKLGDLLGYFP